jgi:hypothetical protein
MKFELKKPCKTCPFVIAHEFPLRPDRIEEIRDCHATFSCHNTVDYDGPNDPYDEEGVGRTCRDTSQEQHCLGFLIVAWADWGGFDQVAAMAARMGLFKPEELPTPEEAGVFETWADMIDANEES